jgi:hypothetical protein
MAIVTGATDIHGVSGLVRLQGLIWLELGISGLHWDWCRSCVQGFLNWAAPVSFCAVIWVYRLLMGVSGFLP